MRRDGTLVPTKDWGGCAFSDLLFPGSGARIGVVPATVVRSFDDVNAVIVGKDGEDKISWDGVYGVICRGHCGRGRRNKLEDLLRETVEYACRKLATLLLFYLEVEVEVEFEYGVILGGERRLKEETCHMQVMIGK